jgi:hypothetical protein
MNDDKDRSRRVLTSVYSWSQGDIPVEEYMAKLPEFDADMSSKRDEAEKDGEVGAQKFLTF